jgi:hypothetical protein
MMFKRLLKNIHYCGSFKIRAAGIEIEKVMFPRASATTQSSSYVRWYQCSFYSSKRFYRNRSLYNTAACDYQSQ